MSNPLRWLHLPELPELPARERAPAPAAVDRRDEHGPFDVIGDVHGCLAELRALLQRLGYAAHGEGYRHPQGRRAVFAGDLVDRGPDIPGVLRLVMAMHAAGDALCVPGNHDEYLLDALAGNAHHLRTGVWETLDQLSREPAAFIAEVRDFLEALPGHLVLDGGALVVAHAGLREELHGEDSRRARLLAMHGDPAAPQDERGRPSRWATSYAGGALVVHGHFAGRAPRWEGNTVNIDSGVVYGGALTALRYPERELISVPASGGPWASL